MATVEIAKVTFAYPGKSPVFADFSWRAAEGDDWAVVGPSGCGKSTLLYLVAGLRQVGKGQVLVNGQPVTQPRRSTGLILQDYGLLPWATALDNIAVGLRIRGVGKRQREQVAHEWLNRLGIAALAGQYPMQVSGGQRQRIAIARTLALDPDLLLMDEPFSALDALTREGMQDLVIELGANKGRTTILVTHSISEAVYLARRIAVLGQPPNYVPQIIENPGGGSPGYRQHPDYQQVSAQVRRMVETIGGDDLKKIEE